MSAHDWKPGDVGVTAGITNPAVRFLVTETLVRYSDGDNGTGVAESARPLVVIDPERNEDVLRLASVLMRPEIDVRNALRSLIEPPKHDEPTGRYAEVESCEGTTYYRSPAGTWHRESDNFERPWDHIGAVRVLSEGVSNV